MYDRSGLLAQHHAKPKYSNWQPRKRNQPRWLLVISIGFRLFRISASPYVLLAFSEKESESRNLLKFHANLHPVNLAQSVVVRTRESLIPLKRVGSIADRLPQTNVSHNSFVHYDFVSTSLEMLFVTFVDNVCSGTQTNLVLAQSHPPENTGPSAYPSIAMSWTPFLVEKLV